MGERIINQKFNVHNKGNEMNIVNPYRYAEGLITSAVFLYSFTKRIPSATYTCRIRRDNDDAETDILLESSGACDINSTVSAGGTLATWIGSNNGFMVTDYDQQGNFDFTQSDKTKQAKIVDVGSWLGYKLYDGSNDVYLTSSAWTATEGSVYIKVGNESNSTRYFLSQSEETKTACFSLTTSFGTGNKPRMLVIDNVGTPGTWEGTTALTDTKKLTYRYGAIASHVIRVDGSEETLTESGSDPNAWFGTHSPFGYTLQKGRLIRFNNVGASYREYEMFGFDVEHSDTESTEIESLM